jgi:hypothetical protein
LEALAKVKMAQKWRKMSEETVTKSEAMDSAEPSQRIAIKKEDIEDVSNNELINGCLDAHTDASNIYSKVNTNEPRCPLKLLDDLSAIVGQELENLTNGELDTSSEIEEWSYNDGEEETPCKQV